MLYQCWPIQILFGRLFFLNNFHNHLYKNTNFPIKGKEYVPNHALVSKGFSGIIKIWKSRYAHDSEGSFDYRPFTTTTFAIEYAIFGQNPFVSHLINLLLYFACTWLVFCVFLKLLNPHEYGFSVSFLCALIFKSGGILPSTEIDKLGDELKLNNVCDVVFGDNM